MDTRGGTAGGGHILDVGGSTQELNNFVDWNLLKTFEMMPFVKILIILLAITATSLIVLRLMNIKSLRKGKGVNSEIDNVKELKNRDKQIIKINNRLKKAVQLVKRTPFGLSKQAQDYLQYNLNRAGVKVPTGYRYMTAEEFNAICVIAGTLVVALGLIVSVLINSIGGVILIMLGIVGSSAMPKMMLRSKVHEKDKEIRENFSDFYLMLHYVLMIGGNTPLDKLMKSYLKITESEEMKRFMDVCIGHIDTHSEYAATGIITKEYREIPEVGKLMRLIKQLYDGADVQQDLIGFRESLMTDLNVTLKKKRDKLEARARRSSILLMIILFQAVLSAIAIYLPDLGGITTFM